MNYNLAKSKLANCNVASFKIVNCNIANCKGGEMLLRRIVSIASCSYSEMFFLFFIFIFCASWHIATLFPVQALYPEPRTRQNVAVAKYNCG